ncbi:hypothetical protein BIV60_26420 [Bacillus sp. MUM 116]|uniref:hypothetical protein n=1 Tax=Bacillus sp. MUM 116 TaxID=1678002 RepID=UPI0008F5827C|nr:hypothetical protein [Bacillus sp. MUM 116]OIK08405.1 hypothetical protein BIV60_26420 [Bacillus sp. MUM 116]
MEKREYLIKQVLGSEYPTALYGVGIDIYNLEGNKYIDGSPGAVTVSIGHGVQEIIHATSQAQKIVQLVHGKRGYIE